MEPSTATTGNHALALRVMRLTKPAIIPSWPLQADKDDYCGEELVTHRDKDITVIPNLVTYPYGEVLTVPQNLGSIYLGETFASFVNVQNDSQQTVRDVVLKTDLQTSSQRMPLSNPTGQAMVSKLVPGDNISEVITHEVKELGGQLLVCTVSYINTSGEKQMFRKYYKFQVLKPLDVRTKFFTTSDEEIFLEAQITNTTPHPLHMQKVVLAPSPLYTVSDLNFLGTGDSIFADSDYINPDDTWQYLYKLSPKMTADENSNVKGVSSVGKLDIMWLSNFGERGRLQSSQLQRLIQQQGELVVTVHSLPHFIASDEQFQLVLRVRNTSDRKYNLHITLNQINNSGLIWVGDIKKVVGEVPPCSHMDVQLDILPIKSGVWDVGEITIENVLTNKRFSYPSIGQILVGLK